MSISLELLKIWRHNRCCWGQRIGSFATMRSSCTAGLSVAKSCDVGTWLMGFFRAPLTYLAMLGHISRALSPTFLSSIHLVSLKGSGNTLDPIIFLPFLLVSHKTSCTMLLRYHQFPIFSSAHQPWILHAQHEVYMIQCLSDQDSHHFHSILVHCCHTIDIRSIHGNLKHFLLLQVFDPFFKLLQIFCMGVTKKSWGEISAGYSVFVEVPHYEVHLFFM